MSPASSIYCFVFVSSSLMYPLQGRAQGPAGVQGPVVSLASIAVIIVALLLFIGGFGAMFWFMRYSRARRSRTAADIEMTMPHPRVIIPSSCHLVEPPAAPPYPGLDTHQPPQYSSGQPLPFPEPAS